MSIGAMIYRASNLGMIDATEKSALYRNLTRRGWRGPLQEPFDAPGEMPLERPRMLRRAVGVLVNEGASRATVLAAFALPDKEIEQLASLEKGFFRPVEVHHLAVPKKAPLRITEMESGEVIEFSSARKKS
jgi:hypothetical protein